MANTKKPLRPILIAMNGAPFERIGAIAMRIGRALDNQFNCVAKMADMDAKRWVLYQDTSSFSGVHKFQKAYALGTIKEPIVFLCGNAFVDDWVDENSGEIADRPDYRVDLSYLMQYTPEYYTQLTKQKYIAPPKKLYSVPPECFGCVNRLNHFDVILKRANDELYVSRRILDDVCRLIQSR